MFKQLFAVLILTLTPAALASAAAPEHHAPAAHTPADHPAATHADPEPHPTLPATADWAKTLIGIIAAMFLVAIPVGIILRAHIPQETPDPHSHDDGHHGHSHATGHH